MLNNLSYIHHFVGIFEKNQHSFHDDNNNETSRRHYFQCLFTYFTTWKRLPKNYPSLAVN